MQTVAHTKVEVVPCSGKVGEHITYVMQFQAQLNRDLAHLFQAGQG